MEYPAGFYVYQLVDPRDDKAFYAGKGQRGRAWEHERNVRSGKPGANPRKNGIITEIIAAGLSVKIQIVATYDLESEALDHEFRLIDVSPHLTNVVPGGQGQGLSQREADRRATARLLRLRRLRARERDKAAHADLVARRESFVAQARNDAEREEVRAWLNGASGPEAKKLLAPKQVLLNAERDRAAAARLKAQEKPRRKGRQFGRRFRGPSEINPEDFIIR